MSSIVKKILIICLLTVPYTSYANQDLLRLCNFMGNNVRYIIEDVNSTGQIVKDSYYYKDIERVFATSPDQRASNKILKSTQDFIKIAKRNNISPKISGDFLAHACYNKYLQNNKVLETLAPIVKTRCTENGNVSQCIREILTTAVKN